MVAPGLALEHIFIAAYPWRQWYWDHMRRPTTVARTALTLTNWALHFGTGRFGSPRGTQSWIETSWLQQVSRRTFTRSSPHNNRGNFLVP